MANFLFLKNAENEFYKINMEDIINAEERIGVSFPKDLKQLYSEIGYGFIKGQTESAINRILGPGTLADIRLREGVFEFDPDLDDIYDDEDKLIFFEVNEGVYLSVDLTLENTPVFYFDTQIANSLEDFFKKFLIDNEFYLDFID